MNIHWGYSGVQIGEVYPDPVSWMEFSDILLKLFWRNCLEISYDRSVPQ
jgi:hypothetical protein